MPEPGPARVALSTALAAAGAAAFHAALGAAGAIALSRSAAAALGGDGRSAVLTAAAAFSAFAIGARRSGAPIARRGAFAAAGAAAAAMLVLPMLESTLSGWVRAAGEGWRGDLVTLALAAIAVGYPMARLGAAAAGAGVARPALTCLGAAAAVLVLDAPWIPLPLAQILGLAAPFALAAAAPRAAAPSAIDTRPLGTSFREKGASLREEGATAALGWGLAFAILLARIELRSFVRGTTWELGLIDATMLVIAALGAAVFAWALAPIGSVGRTSAVALAALGFLFSLRRLASISLPVPFSDLSRTWGLTTDRTLDAGLLALVTVPLTFLTAGGAAATALAGRGPRALRALALGFGVGLALATHVLDGRSFVKPEGWEIVDGFSHFAFFAVVALGAAGALFAIAPREGWRRLGVSAAIVIAGAFAARELSPAPFRPAGLFWNIVFAEGHSPHAVRETVDGAALLVEEPVREEDSTTKRVRRVRVDRVDRTPDLDDRGGYELAIATAAAIHGAPERVLLLAPPLPRTIELLRRAGAKAIDTAPLPAIASSVAAPFAAVEIGDAGPDGLRPAAGQRGYDLVVMPPTPSFPADAASSLRARHLRALESALAPQGVVAVFLDAATTPIDVVAALASEATSGRPNAGTIFVADGVHGVSIGILSRAGDAPLVSTRSAFAPGPLAELAPSLSPDLATIRAQIFKPEHRSLASSLSSWLPPISTARSFARVALDPRANRAAVACLAERWLAEAGSTAPLVSARQLAAAVAEMESAEWIRNTKRIPAETIPIPTPATDAVAASIAALPGPGPGRAAYRQLAHLLETQREVSRLFKFAGAVHASDPGNWRASRDVARTTRELLDPEGALQMLDQTAMPDDEEGLIGFSVERARILLALKRGDESITGLRLAMQAHPTSVALALELAETYKALGNMADATLWAKHAETLHKAAEARGN